MSADSLCCSLRMWTGSYLHVKERKTLPITWPSQTVSSEITIECVYALRHHEPSKVTLVIVSPTSDGVGQHLLFADVSGKESKEISMWIDKKQEEQSFAGSFRLNPMDEHVKHMMRSVDSLKGQTEYNMDT
eukprot:270808-Amphidinium_carterae.1